MTTKSGTVNDFFANLKIKEWQNEYQCFIKIKMNQTIVNCTQELSICKTLTELKKKNFFDLLLKLCCKNSNIHVYFT